MKNITLYIETRDSLQEIPLEDEISVGRTNLANVVVDDVGLSRVNTTFFRDGEMLLVVDERSLNGTFLNGEKIGDRPVRVLDGDKITIGSETEIRVEFAGEKSRSREPKPRSEEPVQKEKTAPPKPKPRPQPAKPNKPPMVLIVATLLTFAIVFFTGIALVIVSKYEGNGNGGGTGTTVSATQRKIPRRVIDPLGGVDPDDIEDIFSSWEVQDQELDVNTVEEIKTTANNELESANLNVPIELFKKQMARSKAGRGKPTGNDPPGQIIPPELRNRITKQIAKINEMKAQGYQLPMDYSGLAQKRQNRKLVEMPIATEDYVLDVGGSADGSEFNKLMFVGSQPIANAIKPGTAEYDILSTLATTGYGQKYDINNPDDRRQIKRRLLRMFHPNVKPVLVQLAKSYREKFNYPLRVTSLSRSMEYQIGLNKGNANSYRVRDANAVPPHTSGCTFDLSRKFMSADEQNFIMMQLAEMEKQGKVDALREGGANACFHVFILQGCEV